MLPARDGAARAAGVSRAGGRRERAARGRTGPARGRSAGGNGADPRGGRPGGGGTGAGTRQASADGAGRRRGTVGGNGNLDRTGAYTRPPAPPAPAPRSSRSPSGVFPDFGFAPKRPPSRFKNCGPNGPRLSLTAPTLGSMVTNASVLVADSSTASESAHRTGGHCRSYSRGIDSPRVRYAFASLVHIEQAMLPPLERAVP
jgi:hypothetical protein